MSCDCAICKLSRDLEAEPLNRERLEAGFNWLLEDGCERDMEFAFLLTAVAEYTKSHDAPELVEALRVISPRHAGVAHPDYKPPPRRKIVYAPTFVEGYADLTGQSVKEARAALRQGEGSFHLEAVSDERP